MQPGEPPTLQHLLDRALALRERLVTAHAELTETEVTGHAGGLVTVTMRGTGEVTRIKIDPGAVDARHVSTLEDLLLAALRNAQEALGATRRQLAGPLAELAVPSDGLPGLGW